jgi:proteasome lid subunit RPN8/RPN11
VIKLKREHLEAIKTHGEQTYPYEGCGVLIGRANGEAKFVEEVRPTENARLDSRHNRYLIPPDELLRVERDARSRGLEVLGYFHSHPNAEARPSQYDLDHAWPWYSYLIVSVKAEKAEALNAWVLKDDRSQFEQEEISLER